MTDERWERVKAIIDQALDTPDPRERARYLSRACEDDAELRSEVESLLAHEADSRLQRSSALAELSGDADDETALRDSHRFQIGRDFGPYRILGKLGAGGMGEVYRARDARLQRDVALKVLPAAGFTGPSARGRLVREARSAAGLNHPHICTVFEVGEAEGQAYIAMELIEGEPLSRRLSRGPLPLKEVSRFGRQLTDALAHAHERGVVHRDLKSANVVITSDGRAKVLDFGLAKRLPDGEHEGASSLVTETRPGTVMGTLPYMSPEQLRGEATDPRTDVWALGVVLYEMLVGVRPFRGSTGYHLSSEILNQAPPPLPPKVPIAWRVLVGRCLEKDPAKRYQSAGEVRGALEAIRSGSAGGWAAWRYLFGRRRFAAVSLALALVAIAAVGLDVGGLRRILFGGRAIESLVVLPLTNLSGDADQDYLADGMTEALIAELSKLDGLRVVSRTSSMQYKRADKPVREIVRELGVDGAIEGGVVREGDLVRATISLIDGSTETSLWAQSFEREATGVLALHGEMARAIADGVQLTLSPTEEARLSGAGRVDPEAYEAYLKGRMHWYKQTPQEVDRALQYFQLAVEKDPDFALAHLGMGYVWTYYASVGLMPPGEMRSRVLESLKRAREIDATLADAYEAQADVEFYYDWDWAEAQKNYERAVELKPNSADMRLYYWEFLVAMNRPNEAKAQIERCLELDPFNSYVQMAYGMFLLSTRRFDEAVAQFQEISKTDMDFGPAQLGLAQAYHHLGRHPEALAAAEEYFSKWGDDEMAEVLAAGFEEEGYRGAMRRAAEKLEERSEYAYVLGTQVASLFAYAGENDRALDWLEKAYQERETGLVKLQVDPDWDGLRQEPRFRELVERMDFPPA